MMFFLKDIKRFLFFFLSSTYAEICREGQGYRPKPYSEPYS